MENNIKFIDRLDKILLSKDVQKSFYESYTEGSEFKQKLDKMLPEILLCESQEQKTPWHLYNVLDHILHSISNINKLSNNKSLQDKRILVYTMFLHDIGKPLVRKTVTFDGKEYDSYKGHNIESCKIAERVLPNFSFNKKEIKEILELIEKHDIFSQVSDKETSLKNKTKLDKNFIIELKQDMSKNGDSEKLGEFLGLVAKADNLAQNPELTSEPIRIIDKYLKMIELENQNEKQYR